MYRDSFSKYQMLISRLSAKHGLLQKSRVRVLRRRHGGIENYSPGNLSGYRKSLSWKHNHWRGH